MSLISCSRAGELVRSAVKVPTSVAPSFLHSSAVYGCQTNLLALHLMTCLLFSCDSTIIPISETLIWDLSGYLPQLLSKHYSHQKSRWIDMLKYVEGL